MSAFLLKVGGRRSDKVFVGLIRYGSPISPVKEIKGQTSVFKQEIYLYQKFGKTCLISYSKSAVQKYPFFQGKEEKTEREGGLSRTSISAIFSGLKGHFLLNRSMETENHIRIGKLEKLET